MKLETLKTLEQLLIGLVVMDFKKEAEEKIHNCLKEVKEDISVAHSSMTFKYKHKTDFKELRPELIEFLEANNYFISVLKTKKNAIGIVDNYLKVYKP